MSRFSTSLVVPVGGAIVVAWATMTAAMAALIVYTGGRISLLEAVVWGTVAVLPAGLGGWLCAAVAQRARAATWPLAVAPGALLAAAAGMTAASAVLGRMPWDHDKAGPLLIAGLLVLASGPTFLGGVWARRVTPPTTRTRSCEEAPRVLLDPPGRDPLP
jgi:hypothetical protein